MAKRSEEKIPDEWKQTVRRILLRGDKKSIVTTQRAQNEWAAFFPDAWEYDRNEAIATTLNQSDLQGVRVYGMREPGEVWEFFASYQSRKLYVKINLLPKGKIIFIYSVHPPNKGDKL